MRNKNLPVLANAALGDINNRLQQHRPLLTPKTWGALLLRYLQYIPEARIKLNLSDCIIEVLEVRNLPI
jgi:Mg2+/Co2+ transporter CorB